MKPTTEELIGGARCPLGEFHEGRTYQLVRHDLRIRELEAELKKVGRCNCGLGGFSNHHALIKKMEREVKKWKDAVHAENEDLAFDVLMDTNANDKILSDEKAKCAEIVRQITDRAEKAEKELATREDELEAGLEYLSIREQELRICSERLVDAEARVAELERQLALANTPDGFEPELEAD